MKSVNTNRWPTPTGGQLHFHGASEAMLPSSTSSRVPLVPRGGQAPSHQGGQGHSHSTQVDDQLQVGPQSSKGDRRLGVPWEPRGSFTKRVVHPPTPCGPAALLQCNPYGPSTLPSPLLTRLLLTKSSDVHVPADHVTLTHEVTTMTYYDS